MKKSTFTISFVVALSVLIIEGCTQRQTPKECIRFDGMKNQVLSDTADYLAERWPKSNTEDFTEDLYQRGETAEEAWIRVSDRKTEVSLRSHDFGFSEICVHDLSRSEDGEVALSVIVIAKTYLEQRNIEYRDSRLGND